MVIIEGWDADGVPITRKPKEHNFSELPGKGFARDMSGVGLLEIVNISPMSFTNEIIAVACKAEIERRANQLQADINEMEIPPGSASGERRVQLWFTPKRI